MYRLMLLFALIASTLGSAQQSSDPIKTYQSEEITVKSYNFDRFEQYLNRTTDTTYVINFWATWCTPCIKELPHFEKLNALYRERNVKVLLVSMDMPRQVQDRLIPFIRKKQLKSEVILLDDPDANSWIEKVDPSWSGAIPATVIYNRSNRKFYEQSFTYEQLETEINQLIA